jgi:phosphatidylinositol glycan class B
MPVVSVRFSSENYSGLLFLSAVYLILKNNSCSTSQQWLRLPCAGLLLGFSFYFRFQVGFAILGLGMWLLFMGKMKWSHLLCLALFGAIAALGCTGVDRWFYGDWVLTPVNYFHSNIVENKAANWGVDPWWYYFKLFFLQSVPPISLLLLVLFFTGISKHRLSLFAWCLLPFLLAHFAVGHKEMRFLFPIVFAFIYLSALGFDWLITSGIRTRLLRIAVAVAVIVNMPLLLVKMFTPAQEVVPYYRFLYRHAAPSGQTVLAIEKDPYDILDLKMNFYRPPGMKTVVLAEDAQLVDFLSLNRPQSILLLERNVTGSKRFPGYRSRSVYCLLPSWVLHFNFNNWVGRSRIWNIRQLERMN